MSDCEKYNNGFDLAVLEDISEIPISIVFSNGKPFNVVVSEHIGETPVSTVFSNGRSNVNAFFADGISSICLPEVEGILIPWYVFGSDVVEINNNHFGVVYFK